MTIRRIEHPVESDLPAAQLYLEDFEEIVGIFRVALGSDGPGATLHPLRSPAARKPSSSGVRSCARERRGAQYSVRVEDSLLDLRSCHDQAV